MNEFLNKLKHELNTQDGRYTADPIFLVQEKVRVWGLDSGHADDYVWGNVDSGEFEEADDEKAEQLEEDDYWQLKEEDLGWQRYWYRDYWEYVQTFFTEKGANDYIERNRHHHKGELRTYVDSLYRNDEMRTLRDLLKTKVLSVHASD